MKHEQDFAPAGVPTVEELQPAARFSLRARDQHRDAVGRALDIDLPTVIGRRNRTGTREVLCLGPDEWLLVAEPAGAAAITDAMARIYDSAPHALANISDREVILRIAGRGTLDLLAIGCPRNIAAVLPGHGLRTVFDRVSVVLWRDGVQDFRLEVWRSFAPHVQALLEAGRAELAAGL